ncbi:MAG: coenzyme transferase [Proteobacteria bacterium]|nr:coenzyme transferase [Pseudomonadota bacterium]
MPSAAIHCTLGEALIYQIARSIEDGVVAFHGFGSPLVQLALHLAKRTHAPRLVLVAGATYAVNPAPPFLTPTSNDWAMSRGAQCHLDIGELFDLAASGRLGRMFLSGLQIDRYGNMNVTRLGRERLSLKLPGGGGGGNLSCDARRITIWTAAHRSPPDGQGRRRFRLVENCDFVTSLGHRGSDGRSRGELGHKGFGPDRIVTELGVFDFDETGQARLAALYPDTSLEEVRENTGFEFPVRQDLTVTPLPTAEMVQFIRELDPLGIHERELRPEDSSRRLTLS